MLDKITGKNKIYNVKNDENISYSDIEIQVKRCVKVIDPYNEDSLCLFEIYSKNNINKKKLIFSGWISKKMPFINNICNNKYLISIINSTI